MLGNQILGSCWGVWSWLEAVPLVGPLRVEQCSTAQGWGGCIQQDKKAMLEAAFLPPCLQMLLSWSWKEPGSRKPFLQWQPAASCSKQPAPKPLPTAAARALPAPLPAQLLLLAISPSCSSDLCANPHASSSQQNPAKPGRYLLIWVVFNVGASLD